MCIKYHYILLVLILAGCDCLVIFFIQSPVDINWNQSKVIFFSQISGLSDTLIYLQIESFISYYQRKFFQSQIRKS